MTCPIIICPHCGATVTLIVAPITWVQVENNQTATEPEVQP